MDLSIGQRVNVSMPHSMARCRINGQILEFTIGVYGISISSRCTVNNLIINLNQFEGPVKLSYIWVSYINIDRKPTGLQFPASDTRMND